MSISAEYAREHKDSPAVLCCRAEAGVVLSEHNLEDPAIFDDLVDTGLLNLEGALTIGQVLGATLTKTADSLTPVTAELVDAVKEAVEETPAEAEEAPAAPAATAAVPVIEGATTTISGGVLRINIAEGKGIHIELPIGVFA